MRSSIRVGTLLPATHPNFRPSHFERNYTCPRGRHRAEWDTGTQWLFAWTSLRMSCKVGLQRRVPRVWFENIRIWRQKSMSNSIFHHRGTRIQSQIRRSIQNCAITAIDERCAGIKMPHRTIQTSTRRATIAREKSKSLLILKTPPCSTLIRTKRFAGTAWNYSTEKRRSRESAPHVARRRLRPHLNGNGQLSREDKPKVTEHTLQAMLQTTTLREPSGGRKDPNSLEPKQR